MAQSSCPTSCPLQNAGCYAEDGFAGLQTRRLNRSPTTDPLALALLEAKKIREKLSGKLPLRLHVVGDCRTEETARIVTAACEEYMDKHGQPVWNYTHAWKVVPREAWGRTATFASCDKVEDLAEAKERGYAPALVVARHLRSKVYEMGGHKILPCRHQTHGEQCDSCRLCFDDKTFTNHDLTLAFAAHGSGRKAILSQGYTQGEMFIDKKSRRRKDLKGMVFGQWAVLRWSHQNKSTRTHFWWCRCVCGTERAVASRSLVRGKSKSCGCWRLEYLRRAATTHGESQKLLGAGKRKRPSKEYVTWGHLRDRCNNPLSRRYSQYGGRGIKVCKRWDSFEKFLKDMGRAPGPEYSIDRIDPNKNYDPKNCRWADRWTQDRNKTTTHSVEFEGESVCVTDLARSFEMPLSTLVDRLRHGRTPEEAVKDYLHDNGGAPGDDSEVPF